MKIFRERFSEGFGLKLFYKKDYLRVLRQKVELQKEFEQYKIDSGNSINALEERNYKLYERCAKLEDKKLRKNIVLETLKLELQNSRLEKDAVKDELTKAKNQIGGYKKSNSDYQVRVAELKKQVDELLKEIENLKSDRYLIKKLPSGKTPNTNKTKISIPAKPQVQKFMKENAS